LKGLAVDLMIWNEDHAGYRQLLHDQIMGLIAAGVEANLADRPGGIFVRSVEQISIEDRVLLQAVARVMITDTSGTLADQLDRAKVSQGLTPRLAATRPHRADAPAPLEGDRPDLIFFNGQGGFTPDGREYGIRTAPDRVTPAPWVNVLANAHF